MFAVFQVLATLVSEMLSEQRQLCQVMRENTVHGDAVRLRCTNYCTQLSGHRSATVHLNETDACCYNYGAPRSLAYLLK